MAIEPLKKVVVEFDQTGCPEKLQVNSSVVEHWFDSSLCIRCYSWNNAHDISYFHSGADEREKEEFQKGGKCVIKKIELLFNEKEHLETVTIDDCKVFDNHSFGYVTPKTTFLLKCYGHGRDKTIQLTHDYLDLL